MVSANDESRPMTPAKQSGRNAMIGYVTPEQIARSLQVSTTSVKRLIERGHLPALNVGAGKTKKYRVLVSDWENFKLSRSVNRDAHVSTSTPPDVIPIA